MIIVKATGYYNQYGDKRFALLKKGDKLTVIRYDDDKVICHAVCHNSGRNVRVEVEAENAYCPDDDHDDHACEEAAETAMEMRYDSMHQD